MRQMRKQTKRLVVSNNGQPFTPADWSRLKSIADGNPDETKIGAFGVGFYSVFADCDEPFVVSGDRTMAFYWKGNMLSTKAAPVPAEHDTRDTIFMLEYRQANPRRTIRRSYRTCPLFVNSWQPVSHLSAYRASSFMLMIMSSRRSPRRYHLRTLSACPMD